MYFDPTPLTMDRGERTNMDQKLGIVRGNWMVIRLFMGGN